MSLRTKRCLNILFVRIIFFCSAKDAEFAVSTPLWNKNSFCSQIRTSNAGISPIGKRYNLQCSTRGKDNIKYGIENPAGSPEVKPDVTNSFWPPWPFNLLAKARNKNDETRNNNDKNLLNFSDKHMSEPQLFIRYLRQRAKINAHQLQGIASDLSFHLPPATLPLVMLALLPVKSAGDTVAFNANIFSKRLAWSSFGLAAASWVHCEFLKTRRLTPLPLEGVTGDFSRVFLPPFLPEKSPAPFTASPAVFLNKQKMLSEGEKVANATLIHSKSSLKPSNDKIVSLGNNTSDQELKVILNIKDKINYWYQAVPRPHFPTDPTKTLSGTLQEWKKIRDIKKGVITDIRRQRIREELVAFQKIKQDTDRMDRSFGSSNEIYSNLHNRANIASELPLGWALVTGASRGIGRALAVELARWEIPLILVARDLEKLKEVAVDIEECYGVACCVVQADLSQPEAPAQIYEATKKNGLNVDILINNAGISQTKDFVETTIEDIDSILQLNTACVAKLSRLYGKEMKQKRRGRILIVSSICGALPAVPGSSAYAATKAFQKSFALSLGKELESYGVGVTCMMPGAVKDTSFSSRSSMDNALCWKYPWYARTAPEVASRAVRAVLSGDAEVVPGWQNRFLLRVAQPLLPQRITVLIAETSWKPLRFPSLFSKNSGADEEILPETMIHEAQSKIPKRKNIGKHSPLVIPLIDDKVRLEKTENILDENLGEAGRDTIHYPNDKRALERHISLNNLNETLSEIDENTSQSSKFTSSNIHSPET